MPAALFAPSYVLHGPVAPQTSLVLDSPHSGFAFPADFDSVLTEFDLREGEDCFVDQLWMGATERGVPLIAALAPRTYIDYNRHAGDIDLELVEGGQWPHEYRPSGKARLGKALIWRTLDDGRAIYDRKLSVDEVRGRIERYHRP
ncbi:MAG: N-formylglutamate amidohydrolase, partial [Myxococcales bacterium]|nr:N-formylglutamate amidohydrolase [Myxococcales bacterium]